ncbi:MAG: ATP-binding protein [Pyrinomonadaceae bacterium]|nr:ATP-binding protein [Pyrinomonadaceae bacterium]
MKDLPQSASNRVGEALPASLDDCVDPLVATLPKDASSNFEVRPAALFDASFIEMLRDSALIVDPYSKSIVAANRYACETYSFSQDEMIGSRGTLIWTDTVRESRMLAETFANGSVDGFETIHRRSDGLEMPIMTSATLIEFRGSRAVLQINQNLSEDLRDERRIEIASREWRDTVDAVSDMIIFEDRNGKLRRCNQATRRFLNTTFDKINGKDLVSIFGQAGSDSNDHFRQKQWEGRFAGYEQWFEINNHEVQGTGPQSSRWVHVIKDVTKQRQAKHELLRLYSVIEQSTDGTIITDVEGNIVYLNQVFKESACQGRDNCLGRPIYEFKPEVSKVLLEDEVFPLLAQHKVWRATNQVERNRDRIFEEVMASSVVDSDGNALNYVFSFRDVTETRQLESIAEAVNLMENVGYVFSAIRHELGNPINSVKMALTVLEKNYQKWDHEQVHVFISRCLQELGRVEYLLRTLKNFSLHECPQIEDVDIVTFLEQFISFINPDFEKRGIRIVMESSLRGERAVCDPRAMHQVMMNLMANAADALAEQEDPEIRILVSEYRNWVKISVIDNGVGMSEKQLSNLFKPFYTSKPGGSGLGLVIVRKMLVTMAGTIEIESELDKGTNVHISLQASRGEA